MKTLYEQLGVTPLASQTAIYQSYFRLAKKLDPNNPAYRGSERTRAEYGAVQNAYRTLSNAHTRADYDRTLKLQSLRPGQKKARPAPVNADPAKPAPGERWA